MIETVCKLNKNNEGYFFEICLVFVCVLFEIARVHKMHCVERVPHDHGVEDEENIDELVFGPDLWNYDEKIERIFVCDVEEMNEKEDHFGVAHWTEQKCP